MEGVGRGGDETEMAVAGVGTFVLAVDREGPDSRDIGGQQTAVHGLLQDSRADATSLPGRSDRQVGENSDRNEMPDRYYLSVLLTPQCIASYSR
jgi:hypothetical protein